MTEAAVSATERAKAWFLRLYEIPFLLAVTLLAYRNRVLPFDSLTRGEHVYYVGTDPYYHYRVVLATVANFPRTLRFDPFTHFPLGTGAGQFGSLFDVGAALLAIVTGASGDALATGQVLALYPALLGALLFIPFYYLARRLTNRVGAVFATTALVLIPGEFLVRSLAGYADHHVAEALGLVVATLGAFVAVERANRDQDALAWPIRDWRAAWRPLAAIAAGGLGITFYFLVWPPAILLVGIFGIFLAVTLFVDHAKGADTRYLAWGGGGPFLVAGVLLLPTAEVAQLNFNTFSLIQPLACLLLGVGMIGAHHVSRILHAQEVHRAALPVGGTVAGFGAFFSLKFFAPGLYGSLKWGASWVTGIGVKHEILTIAEAQPSSWDRLVGDYSLLITLFVVTLLALVVSYAWKQRRADLLLLITCLVIFQAARTQVRFNYYLALVVALAYGWVAANVAEWTGLNRALAHFFGRGESTEDAEPSKKRGRGRAKGRGARAAAAESQAIRWHQVGALVAVAFLAVPGLVIPDANAAGERAWSECIPGAADYPAWVLGKCIGGPNHDNILWVESLDWMRESTPHAGFSINDVYERPPPGERYAYPEEAYGVLSWWDYGHWIQVVGERPPVANPFQQAAPFASCWLTETDPARANAMLAAWSARAFDRESRACPDVDVPALEGKAMETDFPVRYVMIDDEMAAGKFGAITVWGGVDDRLYNNLRTFRTADGSLQGDLPWTGEWFHDTMLARLYHDDAENLSHYRLVHETATLSLIGTVAHEQDGRAEYGGRFNGLFNRYSREQIDSFGLGANFDSGSELVPLPEGGRYLYDARVDAAVKTFEHVLGAELEGTGATPGATVTVFVPLKSETNEREFAWTATTTAADDGSFTVTVPYATTDYVPVSEGGTDLTVKAVDRAAVFEGPAEAPTRVAEFHIPDRAVLDGLTVDVAFE